MNYEKLCQEAIEVVKDAGAFIRKEFEGFDRNVIEEKSANQLVSYVDVTAEKMLVNGLDQLLDDCGFITEENTIEQIQELEIRRTLFKQSRHFYNFLVFFRKQALLLRFIY